MAVPHNNKINIPLAAPLNFSKLQTGVQPYNGYNDLNSPIYNDCISPLYYKDRSSNEPGSNRPYRDGDIIYDKDGNELLDISNYKGIKRTVLNMPVNTIAVYDEDHYIFTNSKRQTVIQHGEDQTVLDYKATCVRYIPVNLIAITSYDALTIYNKDTGEQIATTELTTTSAKTMTTFHDPVNDSEIISVYEPFGDWDYYEALDTTPEYFEWKAAQKVYLDEKKILDNKKDVLKLAQAEEELARNNKIAAQAALDEHLAQEPTFGTPDWEVWNTEKTRLESVVSEANSTYTTKQQATTTAKGEVTSQETVVAEKEALEREKYDIYLTTNPEKALEKDHFIGEVKTAPSIWIFKDNTLTQKTFTITAANYKVCDRYASADSYILTGMYDSTHYRTAVVPYKFVAGTGEATTPEGQKVETKYWTSCIVGINDTELAPDKTFLTSKRLDNDTVDLNPVTVRYMGSGKNFKISIFCELKYRAPEGSQAEFEKILKYYNNFCMYYDLGSAKYTFFSPCASTAEYSGNANKAIGTYYNYEISSDNISDPDYIFREIVNNGVVGNISVTPNKKSIGTFIETPNSLDIATPIFYKNGVNGDEVVYKLITGDWIDTKIIDKVEKIKILNEDYIIIETPEQGNCIRIKDSAIKHWAADWNNRFSLVGSPYEEEIPALSVDVEQHHFKYDDTHFAKVEGSVMFLGSAENCNFEVTTDEIVGYTAERVSLSNNSTNIVPIAFQSDYDLIDIYAIDFALTTQDVPAYYTTIDCKNLIYRIYNNVNLSGLLYPTTIVNTPGLFYDIKPTNFGRYYLKANDTFYSLILYNGRIFYAYFTSSLLDDIKEIFMVQGQTFAISKSEYLYTVNLNAMTGGAALGSAIINVKGLIYCGSIPEAAIFYSPMTKTLKSFAADHVLKDMQQATKIDNVYYTTYNPQTQAVYIATNNGLYIYGALNQFRIPLANIDEVYFSSENIYIVHDNITTDISYRQIEDYSQEPVKLSTRYYGPGNNGVLVTDCVYFRLYNEDLEKPHFINISEKTITDNTYKSASKKTILSPSGFDKDTHTCYFRYQPSTQRSVGIEVSVETDCGISEIVFSTSGVDTTAISKPTFNS